MTAVKTEDTLPGSFNKVAAPTSGRLLGYLNSWGWRARDRQLAKALRAGQDITSQYLLKLEMGVFPPPGLNIPPTANDNIVAIQAPYQNKDLSFGKKVFSLLATGGYVNDPVTDPATGLARPSPRTLFINPLLASPIGGALTLLAVGVLAHLGLLLAALSPFLAVVPAALFAVMGASSLRIAAVTSLIDKLYNSLFDTVGHEHIHILQRDDMETGRTGINLMTNAFKNKLKTALKERGPLRHAFDNALSGNCVDNFLQDVEVQARLHTVLAHACRKHGRLPTTKHELWAALIDAGMQAPGKIHEELKRAANDDGKGSFYQTGLRAGFNRMARRGLDKSTAELNAVYRAHIFPDLKEKFWQETIPYLYGHLLELYGHRQGRKEMGFSPNSYR